MDKLKKGRNILKTSDNEIIDKLFDRDEQAISDTEKKYGSLCRKIACNILKDYDEANACVNTSYFNLWSSVPPNKPRSLKAYICSIVRNNALRMKKKNPLQSEEMFFMELTEAFQIVKDAEEEFDNKNLSSCINAFLTEQKEENRKVFVLRYYYNFTYKDIAYALGIKEATVKTKLFRLRDELKSHLEKGGYKV